MPVQVFLPSGMHLGPDHVQFRMQEQKGRVCVDILLSASMPMFSRSFNEGENIHVSCSIAQRYCIGLHRTCMLASLCASIWYAQRSASFWWLSMIIDDSQRKVTSWGPRCHKSGAKKYTWAIFSQTKGTHELTQHACMLHSLLAHGMLSVPPDYGVFSMTAYREQ